MSEQLESLTWVCISMSATGEELAWLCIETCEIWHKYGAPERHGWGWDA